MRSPTAPAATLLLTRLTRTAWGGERPQAVNVSILPWVVDTVAFVVR